MLFWIGLTISLIGLLLGGVFAMLARYRREIRFFHERIDKMGAQVIQTDVGPVEYKRVGEGYPLLVIHGAMGGFDQGLWLAQGFGVMTYQVISPSRFGYLGTPLPTNATLDLQADLFARLLDELEIQKAAVFAISSGTTSAIRFTSRYPNRVSAVILLSPDSPGEVQMTLPPRFIFNLFFSSDFIHWALITYFGKQMQYVMGLAPKGYDLAPEHKAIVKKIMLGDLPVSRRKEGMIFETFTSWPEFKNLISPTNRYPLSEIQAPVLVISAKDDPISLSQNVHGLAEMMPNAQKYVAGQGGHLLFGHTDEVRAKIAQFLRFHTTNDETYRIMNVDANVVHT